MRALKLGNQRFPNYRPFEAPENPLDFDTLVLDPMSMYAEFGVTELQGEARVVGQSYQERLGTMVMRRQYDVMEFLAIGRVIFVHLPPPLPRLQTGSMEVSAWALLPPGLEPIRTAAGSGEAMEICESGRRDFGEFWERISSSARYSARFISEFGRPWLRIKGTGAIVGADTEIGGGRVVFIPDAPSLPADEWDELLGQLALRLTSRSDNVSPPLWLSGYRLIGESEALTRVRIAGERVDAAKEELDTAETQLAQVVDRKSLVTASGLQLESLVASAFECLGFDVHLVNGTEEDIVLRDGEAVAVVEVKGNTKSASIDDGRSLEQWANDFRRRVDDDDDGCKAILLVTPYRLTPLENWPHPAFPSNVVTFAVRRNHCLLTGVQLLGLVQEVEQSPERAPEIRAEILATVGEFPRYRVWSDVFLKAEEPVE